MRSQVLHRQGLLERRELTQEREDGLDLPTLEVGTIIGTLNLTSSQEVVMPKKRISLERQILEAFTRAYGEGRLDVAEHLLRALEVLQRDDWLAGAELNEAYLTVCRCPRT